MTTDIEWTDDTWNPIVGCTVVSPGCTNCYAMRKAWRLGSMKATAHYHGLTRKVNGRIVWTGAMRLAPEPLFMKPFRWKKPKRIFVNSMGDLFHDAIPDALIDRVMAVVALNPQHTFQILTKRPDRMAGYCSAPETPDRIYDIVCDMTLELALRVALIADPAHERHAPPAPRVYLGRWPLPNVWLGVSAEDQTRAEQRIPLLLATPAAKRFVSAEPLLGRIDFRDWLGTEAATSGEASATARPEGPRASASEQPRRSSLDWTIAGGESGPGARPPHPDWFRSIREQCAETGIPFFFKQFGSWAPLAAAPDDAATWPSSDHCRAIDGSGGAVTGPPWPQGAWHLQRVGKKNAGHLLDGREHHAFPDAPAPADGADHTGGGAV